VRCVPGVTCACSKLRLVLVEPAGETDFLRGALEPHTRGRPPRYGIMMLGKMPVAIQMPRGTRAWPALQPLIDSPFGLLDTRNILRLVIDLVSPNDLLCVALACRPLRDAVFARFRLMQMSSEISYRGGMDSPERGADQHQVLRTSATAVVATVTRLLWVRGLPERPSWVDSSESVCINAARHGMIDTLQWEVANGSQWGDDNGTVGIFDWQEDTCSNAARGGHLSVLQWARAKGYGWNSDTSDAVCISGSVYATYVYYTKSMMVV
jgi:hypothetical protein